MIHNIELKPGQGGKIMRSAGTYAKIIKKEKTYIIIKLFKGKLFSISPYSLATIGSVSGSSFTYYKAGQSR
jgi:large subunit ribosomal protein L2